MLSNQANDKVILMIVKYIFIDVGVAFYSCGNSRWPCLTPAE